MQLPDPGDNMDDDSDSDMSDISGLSETVWKTTPGKKEVIIIIKNMNFHFCL